MKPVALIAAQSANSSRRGDRVLDPFAGSGSTLIACEQLGRRCFASSSTPRYCDVIRDRYREYRMAAERKPGSDRGRPSIDWEQAFRLLRLAAAPRAQLPRGREEFEVSVRTVERHGRAGSWKQRRAPDRS